MNRTILVVDDEPAICQALQMILEYEHYRVVVAQNGSEGLRLLEQEELAAVFLDIKMPGRDGLEILPEMLMIKPGLPVIMISGHGSIETAVQATKAGAYDFIEKPLDKNRLLLTLRNALALDQLQRENSEYKTREKSKYCLIGSSSAMQKLMAVIERTGPTKATTLITGESGTGKELVARSIHERSYCANGPFIQVNCAAIPEDLIENELFGHEKGSYSGATSLQRGKFELADGGTIFLDEIADMSLKTQAKVLRVLQEKEFQRVGGPQILHTDVRIIAATNKKLTNQIREGLFREDLFFRLNVVPITVPPLRERKEDIPDLVRHFMQLFCLENGFKHKEFSPGTIDALTRYNWPGNVRELKNIVERMIILSETDVIDQDFLPDQTLQVTTATMLPCDPYAVSLKQFKDVLERYFLVLRLNENNWNIQKTAEAIDTPRSNLYKKIEQYSISEQTDTSGSSQN
ncbi:sigma-54-dependent Fis family transcriptional regulator [bacterium]|nr:sigma-54-dependent Fis family transcriptional regulator [bacterium]